MKLYESDEQVEAWDFIENKKIDIIEEESNTDIEVAYICTKCQKKYKEKANAIFINKCKKCLENYLYESHLFTTRSDIFSAKTIINYIFIFVFSIFSSAVTVRLETFDTQLVYMTICITVFLIGVYMLLQEYFNNNLMKNPNYQRYCLTTFLLLKQEDLYSLNDQINLSIAGLIKKYFPDSFSNEDIVYRIKTKNKSYYKFSNHKREIKFWGKLIQNDAYFNNLVSDFETKSIITFKSEKKIANMAVEFLITFIGIFMSVVNYINNWERFGLKSLGILVLMIIIFFIVILPVNNFHNNYLINEAKMRLIVVSSAIAKKCNQNTSKNSKEQKNGQAENEDK